MQYFSAVHAFFSLQGRHYDFGLWHEKIKYTSGLICFNMCYTCQWSEIVNVGVALQAHDGGE